MKQNGNILIIMVFVKNTIIMDVTIALLFALELYRDKSFIKLLCFNDLLCRSEEPGKKPLFRQYSPNQTADPTMSQPSKPGEEKKKLTEKEASLNRRTNEQHRLIENKNKGYEKFRDRHGHVSRYCQICSEFTSESRRYKKVVTHTHFSTLVYRTEAPADENGNYPCFHCKDTPHSFKPRVRYALILSSSTLHYWQGKREINKYRGNDIHVEEITIPGGTVDDLRHAFEAEYSNSYRCVDVLLVCGLNDVLRNRSVEQVLKAYKDLQETVHRVAPANQRNSVAIATLIIPPKIAGLDDVSGKLKKMVDINAGVRELNAAQPQEYPVKLAPLFHTWGMGGRKGRSTRPRFLLEGMQYHRPDQWREDEKENQLHLSDATRLRMGRCCVEYFKALYGITPCLAASKEEGLKKRKGQERKESSFHCKTQKTGPASQRSYGHGGQGSGYGHGGQESGYGQDNYNQGHGSQRNSFGHGGQRSGHDYGQDNYNHGHGGQWSSYGQRRGYGHGGHERGQGHGGQGSGHGGHRSGQGKYNQAIYTHGGKRSYNRGHGGQWSSYGHGGQERGYGHRGHERGHGGHGNVHGDHGSGHGGHGYGHGGQGSGHGHGSHGGYGGGQDGRDGGGFGGKGGEYDRILKAVKAKSKKW